MTHYKLSHRFFLLFISICFFLTLLSPPQLNAASSSENEINRRISAEQHYINRVNKYIRTLEEVNAALKQSHLASDPNFKDRENHRIYTLLSLEIHGISELLVSESKRNNSNPPLENYFLETQKQVEDSVHKIVTEVYTKMVKSVAQGEITKHQATHLFDQMTDVLNTSTDCFVKTEHSNKQQRIPLLHSELIVTLIDSAPTLEIESIREFSEYSPHEIAKLSNDLEDLKRELISSLHSDCSFPLL